MIGPEYKRSRLMKAAELLRAAKVQSFRDLAISCWVEERQHVVEVLNCDKDLRKPGGLPFSARMTFTSPLDVPSYAEFIEAVMSRCRV